MNSLKNSLRTALAIMVVFAAIAFTACSSGPQPILFGEEACTHCKMTISDQKYGAEIVTKKGKVFKFDATECMLQYIKAGGVSKDDIAEYLVIDASQPGTLVNATQANYLITENLPSPMGGNINAFLSADEQQKAFDQFGGKKLGWNELQNLY